MKKEPNQVPDANELRRQAEDRLQMRRRQQEKPATEADTQRLLHELQVHQIELEMQNDELRSARNEMEALLEKYTDLYDVSPVGYFSMDTHGHILEVNLTGASQLGVPRSELLNQDLARFIIPESRPDFLSFLEKVFAQPVGQSCEAALVKADCRTFWAAFHGTSALYTQTPHDWCRVAVSDITALKLAEEAQDHLDTMALANEALQEEIRQRKAVEEDLRQSKAQADLLLEQAFHMQENLRLLSRRVYSVQEEERKRISRELHDEITQALISISVHLEALSREAGIDAKGLQRKIDRTRKLVEKTVDVAQRFTQELRPAMLDDLGLIPALHTFLKNFMRDTGVRVTLNTVSKVEKLDSDKHTAIYRVVQEALTNIGRHAHASRAEVNITQLPDAIELKIKDNGRSFEVDRVLSGTKHIPLGLIGMRERMEMIGGTLSIVSAPGNGTTVHALIPLNTGTQRKPRP